MKNHFKLIFALITIGSCSPKIAKVNSNATLANKPDPSIPNQSDADRASLKWEGTNLETLKNGKILFDEKCSKCHALPKLTSESESEWNKIVPEMAKKGKIDSESENYILKYVVTMSTRK